MPQLAVVRDIRDAAPAALSPEEVEALETDLFAQFVFARMSSGMTDGTIQDDVRDLEAVRTWLGRPLWEMKPDDVDRYFGQVLRNAAQSTRVGKAAVLRWFFTFLELRYKAEIHRLTGCVVECPLDEINAPRGSQDVKIRIPPSDAEVNTLFASWRAEVNSVRRYQTTARNYAIARLIAGVGLRISELRKLDLDDLHPELGKRGKLHVRFGKGANGSGPRERMVPWINGVDRLLHWYVQDVRGLFEEEEHWSRPGAPLFPSEHHYGDGSCKRISDSSIRDMLKGAVELHLPEWTGRITPHVLRHYCASQLYLSGMDIIAIQELLGHKWVVTTMKYIHVHSRRIDDSWDRAAERAANRLGGILR